MEIRRTECVGRGCDRRMEEEYGRGRHGKIVILLKTRRNEENMEKGEIRKDTMEERMWKGEKVEEVEEEESVDSDGCQSALS